MSNDKELAIEAAELKPCPCDPACKCAMDEPCGGCETYAAWNTRPSPWIPVTPETMPEENKKVPVVVDGHLSIGRVVSHMAAGLTWAVEGYISVFSLDGEYLGITRTNPRRLTHYFPTPPLGEPK